MKATNYPEVGWMKERFQVLTLNNEICEFDWTIQHGGSVPEHLHKESDELFKVLEGELTFSLDGKTMIKKAGEELFVPKMTLHSVSNKSGNVGKCRVSYLPVADQGKFFQILFFLHELNPNDKYALFKAMYISERLNYKEFSTMQGSVKIIMKVMMGFFSFFAFLTGWEKLVRMYVQTELNDSMAGA
ncbi:MAG: cupin domain-containing protein [Saprospiraceae bacterium]|nr:cupin domain-containing protein [Saprospiraceae bacterium]